MPPLYCKLLQGHRFISLML